MCFQTHTHTFTLRAHTHTSQIVNAAADVFSLLCDVVVVAGCGTACCCFFYVCFACYARSRYSAFLIYFNCTMRGTHTQRRHVDKTFTTKKKKKTDTNDDSQTRKSQIYRTNHQSFKKQKNPIGIQFTHTKLSTRASNVAVRTFQQVKVLKKKNLVFVHAHTHTHTRFLCVFFLYKSQNRYIFL